MRNLSYSAWVQGNYNHIAFGIAMANAFAKKGSKPMEYPKWTDPMEKFNKPKITKENLEYEFRKQQSMQNDWLFNRK